MAVKKKDFISSRDEISRGKTRFGTPVYDGIFTCVGTDKYIRVKHLTDGTNFVRRNGRAYKVKGRDDISTSIDYWRR